MVDDTFNEDLYGKAKFPINLLDGIHFTNGDVIREINSAEELSSLMVDFYNQIKSNSKNRSGRRLSLSTSLEKELVLITHSHEASRRMLVGVQQNLANYRQEEAYLRCLSSQRRVNSGELESVPYHDLAFLYYTLMHGQSTLGHYMTSDQSYVSAMRNLKSERVTSPRVLLLGFSSIFSLENLAAMLHLVGFKDSNIVAIDKSKHPLNSGQKYYGNRLFSSRVEYVQQDILANLLDEKICGTPFDLIATHLFFTHFPSNQKKQVWDRVSQLLSPKGIFTDEEIFVNGNVDRTAFNNYFRTLAGDYVYSSDSEVRENISNFMYQFGSTGPFNPYYSTSNILQDGQGEARLKLQLPYLGSRNIFEMGGGIITASMHAVHARK